MPIDSFPKPAFSAEKKLAASKTIADRLNRAWSALCFSFRTFRKSKLFGRRRRDHADEEDWVLFGTSTLDGSESQAEYGDDAEKKLLQ